MLNDSIIRELVLKNANEQCSNRMQDLLNATSKDEIELKPTDVKYSIETKGVQEVSVLPAYIHLLINVRMEFKKECFSW